MMLHAPEAPMTRPSATLDDVRAAYSSLADPAKLSQIVCEVATVIIATSVRVHFDLSTYLVGQMLGASLRDSRANLAAVVLVMSERMRDTWSMLSAAERFGLRALLHAAAAVEAIAIDRPHVEEFMRSIECACEAAAEAQGDDAERGVVCSEVLSVIAGEPT